MTVFEEAYRDLEKRAKMEEVTVTNRLREKEIVLENIQILAKAGGFRVTTIRLMDEKKGKQNEGV